MLRLVVLGMLLTVIPNSLLAGELVGVTVTPHVVAESMRYRRPRDPDLAAKVQLFIRGAALPERFDNRTPEELLKAGEWAWHDLATAVEGPAESLTVWTFNGKKNRWGVGESFSLEGKGITKQAIDIKAPQRWISSITFLGAETQAAPSEAVIHLVNSTPEPCEITGVTFWVPAQRQQWQTLFPSIVRPVQVKVPGHDRGIIRLSFDNPLPLTYAAIEIKTSSGSLWEHLRIKRESFDISGGWTGDNLKEEAYLKLLSSLHVNCGQIQDIKGYTDRPELYDRYPMKLFNRLWPLERWDTDEWLPKIHAVEFLGEPQYGGGRPVAPQEVFESFLPYRVSRLATSVTHSEERIWRDYAGLSDFPHFDAYRVVAPAADSWRAYDRWNGKRISWGAPLETIGDMCRSLREINRPLPTAAWSQGPHDGWNGSWLLSGRARRSPTPAELRAQAVHALSTRITSLYWFNLSLKSLLKFPDTWEPMRRIGREVKMLAPYYLAGDACHFERTMTADKQFDWDFAAIACESCAILFAVDLAYQPDTTDNTFRFGEPRQFNRSFPLPHWLQKPSDVFRVDADGIHPVQWEADDHGVRITQRASQDAIFIVTKSANVRAEIEQRREAALRWENQHAVEPAALEAIRRERSK